MPTFRQSLTLYLIVIYFSCICESLFIQNHGRTTKLQPTSVKLHLNRSYGLSNKSKTANAEGQLEDEQINQVQRLKKIALQAGACLSLVVGQTIVHPPVAFAAPTITQQAPFLEEQTKPEGMRDPTKAQVQEVVDAFRAFDAKKLEKAEILFSSAINNWLELKRPRDEISLLYKARGNVRVDLKRFSEALEDYNKTIDLMSVDGENKDGLANYYEYPDAFVQRGLTFEGLGEWQNAVDDYSRALQLWGGGRGPDGNPYVLNFRGNALTKLGQYKESLEDYAAAGDIFAQQQNIARETDSRANYALALYETGDKEGAVKMMKYITRKNPGYADMHVALAAHAWSIKDVQTAEKEWAFTCDAIDVGCRRYKDLDWVTVVRRWPPSLVNELRDFLGTQKK
mmetsp:Transcript_13611/g.17748  ORF Transcript_13611/g.17748 Transcript_13611/m.17748 type:complete len:397 (+) Transcript_13611:152-1342(+)